MNLALPSIAKSLRTALAAAGVACVASGAVAQINTGVPKELEGIDIIEKPDGRLPLEAKFVDDQGREIRLADYFTGERPIVLQLGYNRCPMLCNLVLNGTFDALKEIDWVPGEQYELLSVSVDPTETAALAKAKKESYLAEFERPGAGKGVHFLTGAELMSRAVADSVGFSYRLQEDGEYSHAAVIMLITPDGRVSRYMYCARFEPKDLRMALIEAGEGRIGTTLERFILWCHMYDPNARGYVLQARRVMSIGGAVTVVVLAIGLGLFWRAEIRKNKTKGGPEAATVN
jgi:protein SCO1/2